MKKILTILIISMTVNSYAQVELRYFGTAGWEISDDNTSI